MEFSFGKRWVTHAEIATGAEFTTRSKQFCLGLHPVRKVGARWHGKVVHIDHCALQHPLANVALQALRDAAEVRQRLQLWDARHSNNIARVAWPCGAESHVSWCVPFWPWTACRRWSFRPQMLRVMTQWTFLPSKQQQSEPCLVLMVSAMYVHTPLCSSPHKRRRGGHVSVILFL